MKLTIGRDAKTSKLQVVDANTGAVKLYGQAGSVPMDVSRQHCEINVSNSGQISVKNLKAENITYVNGLEVMAKNISKTDTLQLGQSRFTVNLATILNSQVPKVVDISPLKKVWDEYHEETSRLTIKEKRLNALSRVSGIFSMAAITSGFLLKGQDNHLYYVLYGIAIVLTLAFTIISYINASKVPEKIEQLKEEFMKNYVCPNPDCHRFLGNTYYSVLSQNSCCPYCKVQYKKTTAAHIAR